MRKKNKLNKQGRMHPPNAISYRHPPMLSGPLPCSCLTERLYPTTIFAWQEYHDAPETPIYVTNPRFVQRSNRSQPKSRHHKD